MGCLQCHVLSKFIILEFITNPTQHRRFMHLLMQLLNLFFVIFFFIRMFLLHACNNSLPSIIIYEVDS